MPRKGPAPKRPLVIDPVYSSPLVTQLVNKILTNGKRSLDIIQIDCLKISANIQNKEIIVCPKSIDLFPRSEIVIFAVDFPGSWRPAVVEHKLLQIRREFWVEVVEGSVQRPFADAGRTGKYDEASHSEKRTQVLDIARRTFWCADGYRRGAIPQSSHGGAP